MTTKNVSPTSTITGAKWHHNISAADLTTLRGISDKISDTVQSVVSEAAKAQINVGRLLCEARDLFPSDEQFGKWRAENTPINSKESANKLMNLARQCGDGRLTKELVESLPISTLKELLTAPDSVIEKVVERIGAGSPPSKTETRQMVKDAKDDDEGGERSALDDILATDDECDLERAGVDTTERQKAKIVNVKGPSEPNKPPIKSHFDNRAKAVDAIMELRYGDRFKIMGDTSKPPYPGCLPIEWAWMVLGLDPSPAYMHARETVDVLLDYFEEQLSGPFHQNLDQMKTTLARAKELIEKEYKDG